MARANSHDKYRDQYEKMGYRIVNLEPEERATPAAAQPSRWRIVGDVLIILATIPAAAYVVGWLVQTLLAVTP